MKTAGLVILIAGLLMMLFPVFTSERMSDMEGMANSMRHPESLNWQPYVGIGVMIIGGGLLVLSKKRPSGR